MVKILSDSTCDLSAELIERYGVDIIPLHIVLGDKEYRDGLEITQDAIFEWADKNKATPKTSAVSIEDAMEHMKPYLDGGMELVIYSISGQMSTTGNVLRMAAEELEASDRVAVVDSANLSTGIGHLVVEGAIMAQAEAGKDAIVARMEELIPKVRSSFVTDTLTYLHRGGRCSAVAAMAGGMLRIHPKIVVKDGAMGASKKYRGKLDAVIGSYVRDMEQELLSAKKDRVFITHSVQEPEIVEQVRQYLESLDHFDEILETRAGGVISSHCGPGTLGVLFIAD